MIPWRPDSSEPTQPSNAFLLRAPESAKVITGDYLELDTPQELSKVGDCDVLVVPRVSKNSKVTFIQDENYSSDPQPFPNPSFTSVVAGKIRIRNPSVFPVLVPRKEHIADIRLLLDQNSEAKIQGISGTLQNKVNLYPKPKPTVSVCQGDKVVLDPDNVLTDVQRAKAQSILKDQQLVFTSKAGKYNGVLGNLDANMTLNNNLVEPPSYSPKRVVRSEKVDEIQQDIMDQMEADGILGRPGDFNVAVTHMHTRFLVPRMDDGKATGEWRLVTSMQNLSPYLKSVRIQLPTVEEAFRKIGKWKYLKNTPFGGERIYLRQPMGHLNATEIELCPNQSNQDLQSDGHDSKSPLKLGWNNTNESSSEEEYKYEDGSSVENDDNQEDTRDNNESVDSFESAGNLTPDRNPQPVVEKEEETANPVDPQFRSPLGGECVGTYNGDGDSNDWCEAVVRKTVKGCLRTYPDYTMLNTRTTVKMVVQNWIVILCGSLLILRIRISFGGDGVIGTR